MENYTRSLVLCTKASEGGRKRQAQRPPLEIAKGAQKARATCRRANTKSKMEGDVKLLLTKMRLLFR